ncbi:pheromone precursor with two tandem repeats of a putative pheromone peptide [Melampsora larici-populina 98AG31]|uniref:Pheromone with two tandem repeats of a putative pheromone peptide n=1 Tax=Melampsora larici-populina (strain 98AG31 / pathotype 3-4-7) TaxID=747676 RepID=F4S0S8_MELLP|nr:pheromone precursor with two tandem repeats of a putative pheromone peptide [Melampsora larici-populina 98AG31]EGG01637.1 pheromone precursor with two tandem repeats of a putative pheromone peptide [Melampsora larici-populina 98AG31]
MPTSQQIHNSQPVSIPGNLPAPEVRPGRIGGPKLGCVIQARQGQIGGPKLGCLLS